MSFIKNLSIAAMTAATVAMGTLSATTAQAMSIVTGSFSGTWNKQATSPLQLNDPYTVTYSYDPSTVRTINEDFGTYLREAVEFNLLSLMLKSGNFSYEFNLTQDGGLLTQGTDTFEDGRLSFSRIEAFDSQEDELEEEELEGLLSAFFGQRFNGETIESEKSVLFNLSVDGELTSVGEELITDAAVIPTPAMLPGLIGMGIAALRKRQAA